MFPISPLEYLIAFALAIAGGALLAIYHCHHVGKVRRETGSHA